MDASQRLENEARRLQAAMADGGHQVSLREAAVLWLCGAAAQLELRRGEPDHELERQLRGMCSRLLAEDERRAAA